MLLTLLIVVVLAVYAALLLHAVRRGTSQRGGWILVGTDGAPSFLNEWSNAASGTMTKWDLCEGSTRRAQGPKPLP